MEQNTIELGAIELVKKFITASIEGDILSIEGLLLDQGNYEMEDDKLVIIDESKAEFIKWYNTKLKEEKITEVIHDQCIGCFFGNQVVIFNNGTFPRIPQESADTTKAGLMLDTNEGKIIRIQFCFTFLKSENSTVYECVGREYVKYIKLGYSEQEAIAMYDANPNSKYSYITKKEN